MASAFVKKPKIFIMGLSSFLGYHLARHLRHKFTVVGCYFKNPINLKDVHAYPMSLKDDTELLERLLAIQAPDFAISAVGITDPRVLAENQKLAENINISLPLAFALMATRVRAKHIYLNSADMFDGKTGNYVETDKNLTESGGYGRMKLTAEAYIRAQTMEGTTLRIGRVLGLGHPYRHTFLDELRMRTQANEKFLVDEGKVNSYLSTWSLSSAVEKILLEPFPFNKQRVFHVGGPTSNELEISQVLCAALGLNLKHLKLVPRSYPLNLSLNSSLMESSFAWKAETKEQLIQNLLYQMRPGLRNSSKHLQVSITKAAEVKVKKPLKKL